MVTRHLDAGTVVDYPPDPGSDGNFLCRPRSERVAGTLSGIGNFFVRLRG
jgi:hypothetical protein